MLPVGWADVEVEPVLDGLALGHVRECQRRWHWAKVVLAFRRLRGQLQLGHGDAIRTAANKAGRAIKVGTGPGPIAITP